MKDEKCQSVMQYVNDMVDGISEDDVRQMFETHIEKCPQCKTKYEIALKIKMILKDDKPKTDIELTESVISRLDPISQIVKKDSVIFKIKENPKRFITVLFCVFAAVLLIISVIIAMNSDTDMSDPLKIDNTQSKVHEVSNIAVQYLNTYFFKGFETEDNLSHAGKYTADAVRNIVINEGNEFAKGDFVKYAFLSMKTLDKLNSLSEFYYYPKSGNGNVAYYKTSLSVSQIEATLSVDLKEAVIFSYSSSNSDILIIAKESD